MLDNATQERLRTLTFEEMRYAIKIIRECITAAKDTQQEVILADKPELFPLRDIYASFPDVISPSGMPAPIPDPLAVCCLREKNPELYEALTEKDLIQKQYIALYLQNVIATLRDMADEAKHSQSIVPQGIPVEYRQFLSILTKPDRGIFESIDKDTQVENYIHLVLKDIKQLHPELYQQYQEVSRAKTGDTPLTQAVKKSISYKYFSGKTKSFCPIYLNDIFLSPQYQAMGKNPKYQLMLLDMINLCNYLAGSRNGSGIESNGFHYTWSDCRVEVSEDTFQKGLKDIVARGWFKVAVKQKLDDGRSVKMYVPSTDWKKKRLSEAEIRRVQQYKDGKQKRLNNSRQRYRDRALKNECETEVKGGF